MVYALQVDQKQALELAVISGGGELSPGDLVDEFDEWLNSEPVVIDREKAQLLTALGVAP